MHRTISSPSFETGLDLDSVLPSFLQADIGYDGVSTTCGACAMLWGKQCTGWSLPAYDPQSSDQMSSQMSL